MDSTRPFFVSRASPVGRWFTFGCQPTPLVRCQGRRRRERALDRPSEEIEKRESSSRLLQGFWSEDGHLFRGTTGTGLRRRVGHLRFCIRGIQRPRGTGPGRGPVAGRSRKCRRRTRSAQAAQGRCPKCAGASVRRSEHGFRSEKTGGPGAGIGPGCADQLPAVAVGTRRCRRRWRGAVRPASSYTPIVSMSCSRCFSTVLMPMLSSAVTCLSTLLSAISRPGLHLARGQAGRLLFRWDRTRSEGGRRKAIEGTRLSLMLGPGDDDADVVALRSSFA